MKKTLITILALGGVALGVTEYNMKFKLNGATNNGGWPWLAPENAITTIANDRGPGAYMFNGGGALGTNAETKEGLLWEDDTKGICLTLCPRSGAGYSGEVIIMDGDAIIDPYDPVSGFMFTVGGSESTDISGTVTLTLAVMKNSGDAWSILKQETSTLTIGKGASVTLTLDEEIQWGSGKHRVAAMVSKDSLSGAAGSPYTLTGITMTAYVPEPATATLSLLALAGLAARRRRK